MGYFVLVRHAAQQGAAAAEPLGGMKMRSTFIVLIVVFGCATTPLGSQPVAVIESGASIPSNCEFVGPIRIGVSEAEPQAIKGKRFEELQEQLLDSAKRIARNWDANRISFVVRYQDPSAHPKYPGDILDCVDCAAYRCGYDQKREALVVPLVALLADPSAYDGRFIDVTAWADLEFEHTALILSPSDKDRGVFENAVHLDVPDPLYEKLNTRFPFHDYLEVVGVFSARESIPFRGRIAVHRMTRREAYKPISDAAQQGAAADER